MQLLFSAGIIFKISCAFHFSKEKVKNIHVHLSVDVRVIVRIRKSFKKKLHDSTIS